MAWAKNPYDEDYVTTRSRIIPIAVDARSQHFDDEAPYVYAPLRDESHRYSKETRKDAIANYNLNDIGLCPAIDTSNIRDKPAIPAHDNVAACQSRSSTKTRLVGFPRAEWRHPVIDSCGTESTGLHLFPVQQVIR